MAQNKTLEVWNGLPTWAKGVIAVAGLAIIYFTANSVVKSIKRKQGDKDNKDLLDAVERRKRELQKQGVRQTLSDAQLESFSQKLAQAFADCGTTEESVYAVFKALNNEADLQALIKIYGTRPYSGCAALFEFGDSRNTLPGAIESELDSAETKKVNDILKGKNINYQF